MLPDAAIRTSGVFGMIPMVIVPSARSILPALQLRICCFIRYAICDNRSIAISNRWICFDKVNLMSDEAAASHLTLDVDRTGNAAVVRCSGKLVAGVNDLLYHEVSQLIPSSKRIVLDLTDLTHMDSTGLGTVVRLYVSAKSAGCDLELINLGKRIRQLLGVTNLLSVFTIIGEHNVRIP